MLYRLSYLPTERVEWRNEDGFYQSHPGLSSLDPPRYCPELEMMEQVVLDLTGSPARFNGCA